MRRLLEGLLLGAVLASAAAAPAGAAVGPLLPVSGSSPFAPGCNGASQTGTEYRDSEVEPWIDVNPASAGNLVGTWQQDRLSTGGANGLGLGVSRDGGATWTRLSPERLPKFTRCQGAAPGSDGDYERASDPWLSFGPNGHLYHISLSFNDTRDKANAILVSESTDGGASWGPVKVLLRDTSSLAFNDKESITADHTDGRYVFAVWDRLVESASGQSFTGPTLFARSTDGGASWEPARTIVDPGQDGQTIANQIVVMPDGDLVNAYALFQGGSGVVAVKRSGDKGATWSGQTIVGALGSVGVTDPRTGEDVRTGDIVPEVAADERPGSDNVYLVWQNALFTGAQRDQIAFAKSTDGGLTWSLPKRISTDPSTQAFTPTIRVDPQGNLGVTYYDFRRDTAASPTLDTDAWFLRSADGGATFAEQRLTPSSFDMRATPSAFGFFLGDYTGLAARAGLFEPFFAKTGVSTPTDVFVTGVSPTLGAPFAQRPGAGPRAPAPASSTGPLHLVRVGRRGRLGRTAALLRLRCLAPRACRGIVRLSAVLRSGGRRRPVLLGARSFRIRSGLETLRVRLNRRVRRLTARRRRIAARALLLLRDDRPAFPVSLRRRR
jgi:hypothetical protein